MGRVLLLDKPEGPTSHDMVDLARKALSLRRVGHTGTLDPMASGLLVLLLGKATRLAELFRGHAKRYRGSIRFGRSTDTDDRTGKTLREVPDFSLDEQTLRRGLAELAVRREQRPPAYSAVKVGGVPLYKKARQGELVEAPPRPVRIESLELLSWDGVEAEIDLVCSAGTYVRSLARDLGEMLGVPAHLAALRRSASGPYRLEEACSAAELEAGRARVLSLDEALAHLPAARASEAYLPRLPHGSQPEPEDLQLPDPPPAEGQWLRILDGEGALAALARMESGPEGLLPRLRRALGD